jgi:hypothetical protein
MLFEITMDFAQIELNITVQDNAHAIEYVTLGIKDILKLDDLEIMAMATNKEGECKQLASKVFSNNCSKIPLHDSPPWLT